MVNQSRIIYEFDRARIDSANRLVEVEGRPVPVPPRALDILLILVQRHGELVTKADLMAQVWPNTFVEESNVAVMISVLRKALGDDGRTQRYIQTVSKSGYRFVAEIAAITPELSLAAAPHAPDVVAEVSSLPAFESDARAAARSARIGVRYWVAASALILLTGLASVGVVLFRSKFLALPTPGKLAQARLNDRGKFETDPFTQNASELHNIESTPAGELYRKGRYSWNRRTTASLLQSIKYYQQAIQADPRYALAYAGLADAEVVLASFAVEPTGSYTNARTAAEKAIELDANLAGPHASLGMVAFLYDWNWKRAEDEFRRAVALQPSYSTAHEWFGVYLIAMGRTQEAIDEFQRASRLDPLSLGISTDIGRALYCARRYDEAHAQLERVLELDPYFANAYTLLGRIDLKRKRWDEATREFRESNRLSKGDTYEFGFLASAQALAGDKAGARAMLEELRKRARTEPVSPAGMAQVLIGLGELDEAFIWFDRACRQHSLSAVLATVDPSFDALRPDPRFTQTLRRVGLGSLPTLQTAKVAGEVFPTNRSFSQSPRMEDVNESSIVGNSPLPITQMKAILAYASVQCGQNVRTRCR